MALAAAVGMAGAAAGVGDAAGAETGAGEDMAEATVAAARGERGSFDKISAA